jgi:hypothetical protein
MFTARFLALAAALVVGTTELHAYVREYLTDQSGNRIKDANGKDIALEWTKNRSVLMHLSLPIKCGPSDCGPFDDGFATFNDSAEDAINIWNQYLAHVHMAVNRQSIVPASDRDANTSVTMSSNIYGEAFGDRVLAVTLVTPRTRSLIEADVVFNDFYFWGSYRGPLNPAEMGYDFHRVALHEFGHVLGLDHPDQATPAQHVVAIMNSTTGNLDSLQADDINGMKSIYDSGPPYLSANQAPNLVNLSTRAFVGTGGNVVIGGFIIQGSQPTTVILRGIGNSLPAFGINNALEDPVIELHDEGGDIIAESDDWIDDSWATTIASYHLDPSNSRESAIMATLSPGTYTVLLRSYDNGDGNLTGTGVVELYDLHTGGGRAGNIATRGPVSSGQVLIGGFIVGGNQTKDVVVRAIGPSLSGAGVSGPLSDPTLELRDASGSLLALNDNWESGPGAYTAIVRSADGSGGIALVEVYDLSPAPN